MGVTIGRERIGDQQIEIEVSRAGVFEAELDGAEYSAKTRDELVEKLRRAYRNRAKLAPVEVTLLDYDQVWQDTPHYQRAKLHPERADREDPEDGYVTHATLRGKNPRTRALLVTIDGKKTALGWTSPTVARRLTEAEVTEFQRLKQAIQDAQAAYGRWLASVEFDVDAWLAKEGADEEKVEEAEA